MKRCVNLPFSHISSYVLPWFIGLKYISSFLASHNLSMFFANGRIFYCYKIIKSPAMKLA